MSPAFVPVGRRGGVVLRGREPDTGGRRFAISPLTVPGSLSTASTTPTLASHGSPAFSTPLPPPPPLVAIRHQTPGMQVFVGVGVEGLLYALTWVEPLNESP